MAPGQLTSDVIAFGCVQFKKNTLPCHFVVPYHPLFHPYINTCGTVVLPVKPGQQNGAGNSASHCQELAYTFEFCAYWQSVSNYIQWSWLIFTRGTIA